MATRGGIVVGGRVIPIEGMRIDNFVDNPKLHLDGRDYKRRGVGDWPRQWILHTTKGEWPQQLLDGVGPPLAAESVLEFWQDDPEHSGAHLVVDGDSALCCADLLTEAAHHATKCNPHSVGVEMYQERGGVIRKTTIANTVRLTFVGMTALNLPLQMASDAYVPGKIIPRLRDGGADFVGIFGHRDQAWRFAYQLPAHVREKYPTGYANRGRGDPGDAIGEALVAAGVELMHCEGREDRAIWRRRQSALNRLGERLVVDGIAGPKTVLAMKRRGFSCGRDIDSATGHV